MRKISKEIIGYMLNEDNLVENRLRTLRAKEVCGDCENGDNSAPMVFIDGRIYFNREDAVKEYKRTGELNEYDKDAIVKVKLTLEVMPRKTFSKRGKSKKINSFGLVARLI